MRSPDLFDKRREPSLEHPEILVFDLPGKLSRTTDFSSPKHIGRIFYETFHILLVGSCNDGRPCRPHRPCTRTRERAIRDALRYRNSSGVPRLEVDLLGP